MTVIFQDKYVFAQLTAFLNRTQFNNYVRKYDGNQMAKLVIVEKFYQLGENVFVFVHRALL